MNTRPRSGENADSTAYDVVYLPLGASAFGGAERSVLDLAAGMVARGKRVLVLAEEPLRNTPFAQIAAERGIELRWVAWRPERTLWRNVLEAVRVFRSLPTRIIHFNVGWRRGMWAIPICARACSSAKLIGSMRVMPEPHDRVPRRRYLGFIPGLRLWRLPDIICGWSWSAMLDLTVSVNSQSYPKRLVRHYGFSAGKLRVIYNGVDVAEPAQSRSERATIRRSAGASDDDLLICYAGRVSIEKGIDLLIQALAQLPVAFKLVVVGTGPAEVDAKNLARCLGLSARVAFAGFQQDPYSLMAAADVVAVPTLRDEAFGRVVAEAMCLGVPVIASSVGGMGELFTHEREGFYVPPGDVASMTKALAQIGADPEARRRMGEQARELALARYSMQRVVEQYAALYAGVLKATVS